MPNRRLNDDELATANRLLNEVRERLRELSSGDESLFWAMRRKLYKELAYDERGKPALRAKLKFSKWKEQQGLCADCRGPLPKRGAVLDHLEAMRGYTEENTRLLCRDCDIRAQEGRGYA